MFCNKNPETNWQTKKQKIQKNGGKSSKKLNGKSVYEKAIGIAID